MKAAIIEVVSSLRNHAIARNSGNKKGLTLEGLKEAERE